MQLLRKLVVSALLRLQRSFTAFGPQTLHLAVWEMSIVAQAALLRGLERKCQLLQRHRVLDGRAAHQATLLPPGLLLLGRARVGNRLQVRCPVTVADLLTATTLGTVRGFGEMKLVLLVGTALIRVPLVVEGIEVETLFPYTTLFR